MEEVEEVEAAGSHVASARVSGGGSWGINRRGQTQVKLSR